MIERRIYDDLPPPVGPYVHAVRCAPFLFVSGLTAFGSAAEQGDAAEQLDFVYTQLARLAANEGIGLKDLVKVTLFVVGHPEVEGLRAVLDRHYAGAHPASSLIHVAGLFAAGLRIEVEAVFALP